MADDWTEDGPDLEVVTMMASFLEAYRAAVARDWRELIVSLLPSRLASGEPGEFNNFLFEWTNELEARMRALPVTDGWTMLAVLLREIATSEVGRMKIHRLDDTPDDGPDIEVIRLVETYLTEFRNAAKDGRISAGEPGTFSDDLVEWVDELAARLRVLPVLHGWSLSMVLLFELAKAEIERSVRAHVATDRAN